MRWLLLIAGALVAAGVLFLLARPARRGCSFGPQRLVFQHDVRAGQRLTFDDVQQRTFPGDGPEPGGVSPYAAGDLLGLELIAAHAAGELIDPEHLRAPRLDPTPALRTVVLVGDRFPRLGEGDLVDVHFAANDVARTALQAVRVIDVMPGQVWLELTATEAEGLVLAQRLGSVALSRRAPDDCEVEETGPVRVEPQRPWRCHWHPPMSVLPPRR